MVGSSADCSTTLFSRGIVIVDTAPGRHDVQAVCMILPPAMAAALRSTSALPAVDSSASGTMNPNVRGSQIPLKRGAAGVATATGGVDAVLPLGAGNFWSTAGSPLAIRSGH